MNKEVQSNLKKELEQEALARDKKRAVQLMKDYSDLQKDHDELLFDYNEKAAPLQEEHDRKLSPIREIFQPKFTKISESMESAKRELLEIGERNKKNVALFVEGNWKFDEGFYLHIKSEAEVKTGPNFSLSKFLKKFSHLIEVKFKLKEIKKVFTDAEKRAPLIAMDVDLKVNETVEIKRAQPSA